MDTCLILGAGSTFADRCKKYTLLKPPLDNNFFWFHRRKIDRFTKKHSPINTSVSLIGPLNTYFKKNYQYDIISRNSPYNSLEFSLKVLYSNLFISDYAIEAEQLIYGLISLLNELLSITTGEIKISDHTFLVKLLKKLYNEGTKDNELSIISFNYDLHTENCLNYIGKQKAYRAHKFYFPGCYRISNKNFTLTIPSGNSNITMFPINKKHNGVKLLKPHGSLNWLREIKNARELIETISKPTQKFIISKRTKLPKQLTFKKKNVFPIIIPPLQNKGTIIRKSILKNVWDEIINSLVDARIIIFYGYSLPDADLETQNILSQTLSKSTKLEKVIIINPDNKSFRRISEATKAKKIYYYKDISLFLNEKAYNIFNNSTDTLGYAR